MLKFITMQKASSKSTKQKRKLKKQRQTNSEQKQKDIDWKQNRAITREVNNLKTKEQMKVASIDYTNIAICTILLLSFIFYLYSVYEAQQADSSGIIAPIFEMKEYNFRDYVL